MSLEIQPFSTAHQTRDTLTVDDALGSSFTNEQLRHCLVASDMDWTMFLADLGRRVFLKKLSDPALWKFNADNFPFLLLPRKYQRVFRTRQEGHTSCSIYGESKDITGLSPEISNVIMALWEDICNLYRFEKLPSQREALAEEENPLMNKVVNEFARKMIELDTIIVDIDHILAPLFDDELLLRTRFFAGQNVQTVRKLTKDVMSIGPHDPFSSVTLQTFPENQETGEFAPNQKLELPPFTVSQVVVINETIRRMLARLFYEYEADVRVVSTNNQAIASTAVRNSPYRDIKNRTPGNGVIGSILDGKRSRLDPRLVGPPLYGPQKAITMTDLSRRLGVPFLFAFGDSAKNDTPMGIQALMNGGVFGVVGESFDSTREHFEATIVSQLIAAGQLPKNTHSLKKHPEFSERVWFLPTEPRTNGFAKK